MENKKISEEHNAYRLKTSFGVDVCTHTYSTGSEFFLQLRKGDETISTMMTLDELKQLLKNLGVENE